MRRAAGVLLVWSLAASAGGRAQEPKALALPAPELERPVLRELRQRRTTRDFSPKALPMQEVSNLLWAAFGVNRPESGGRTAPSARNKQEIDVYVALAAGAYRYDAPGHALKPILARDIRSETGVQQFVAQVPVDLIFVADLTKTGDGPEQERLFYAAADAGFIAENVYLYGASRGLAVCVRGAINKAALAKTLGLRPEQRIILAQSVGYPAPPAAK